MELNEIITLKEAAKILKEQENILLLCHIRPDGDTLGSAYALKYALMANGKNASVSCADEIPERLRFICELEANDRTRNTENAYVCAIDVAESYLLGENSGYKIDMKIDHHEKGSRYATVNCIDGNAAACGEMIFDLISELENIGGGKMTKSAATALYAAISSDTGCFKYSNVTAGTMRRAAALIEAGAESYDVCHRLFEVKTKAELAARRFMLNNTEYYADGRVGVLVITGEFRRENGANDDDIGGIVSEIREVQGVDLAITLKQDVNAPEKFKISMRSSLNVNASDMCALFGGGGHARAAGGAITAQSPDEAKETVIKKVLEKL